MLFFSVSTSPTERTLALKLQSEDIVALKGKYEIQCHRFFSARTTSINNRHVNASLMSSQVPIPMESAVVIPLLKKLP